MYGDYKVSVIVPIYRTRQEYLRTCIESILRQNYPNMEILLIDDGSPDPCGEICDHYAEMDARVAVIHQENRGASAARNTGLELVKGEYTAFVDADDYLEDDCVEILMKRLSDGVEIIACCCMVHGDAFAEETHFYAGDRIFVDQRREPIPDASSDKEDLYLQLMNFHYGQTGNAYTAIGVPWGKLYRTDFLRRNDLRFDMRLPRMEDNIFNMYAFHAAAQIQYIDCPLYHYRMEHAGSCGQKDGRKEVFIPFVRARKDCLNKTGLMKDPKIREAYLEEVLSFIVTILYQTIYCKDIHYRPGDVGKIMEELEGDPQVQDMLECCAPDSLRLKLYLFFIRHRWYGIFRVLSLLRDQRPQ